MGAALYPYSLVPVLAVSVLLFFTAARHGARARGLTAYCLSIALWSGMLAAIWIPGLSALGERFAAVGAFIAASYLHAAYDLTRQRDYRLVYFAYAVAAILTAAGALSPGLLYGPKAMVAGPLFWPSMALAIAAAAVPMWHVYTAYREATADAKAPLLWLLMAGALSDGGGLANAVLLSHGHALPYPMLSVLAGLLVLANVLRALEPPAQRRLLERSLAYSAIAAFLSAGFLFGVMTILEADGQPFSGQYRWAALFLTAMAALAFEPIRQQLQQGLARVVSPRRATAEAVSVALDAQEARAHHAERLAEIGTLTSAVAHEVRNPLGVLAAHVKLLERGGADPDTVAAMREQIQRASGFVEDLLRYGRPRPLDLRSVPVATTAELALSTARQGAGIDVSDVRAGVTDETDGLCIEADPAQLQQLLVVLIDNALLAVQDAEAPQVHIRVTATRDEVSVSVDDNGAGIPEAVQSRLFHPFVTSRKREGPRPGTGLGLAIARGIAERHHGTLTASQAEPLGGARLTLTLPREAGALAPTPIVDETQDPP